VCSWAKGWCLLGDENNCDAEQNSQWLTLNLSIQPEREREWACNVIMIHILVVAYMAAFTALYLRSQTIYLQ